MKRQLTLTLSLRYDSDKFTPKHIKDYIQSCVNLHGVNSDKTKEVEFIITDDKEIEDYDQTRS